MTVINDGFRDPLKELLELLLLWILLFLIWLLLLGAINSCWLFLVIFLILFIRNIRRPDNFAYCRR